MHHAHENISITIMLIIRELGQGGVQERQYYVTLRPLLLPLAHNLLSSSTQAQHHPQFEISALLPKKQARKARITPETITDSLTHPLTDAIASKIYLFCRA